MLDENIFDASVKCHFIGFENFVNKTYIHRPALMKKRFVKYAQKLNALSHIVNV